jgi:hypothetical protein
VFVGHFSASLAAKAADRSVPLWVYVAAAQWLDIVWSVLLLAGLERVSGDPSRSEGLDFISYPYSHSLVAALLWSLIPLVVIKAALKTSLRSAALVAAVVLSHWVLDLIVHHPDLPLWPGRSPKLGLSLWDLGSGEQLIEILLLAIAGIAWGISERRWIAPAIFVCIGALLMLGSGATKPQSTAVNPVQIGLVSLTTFAGFTLMAFFLGGPSRSGRSLQSGQRAPGT